MREGKPKQGANQFFCSAHMLTWRMLKGGEQIDKRDELIWLLLPPIYCPITNRGGEQTCKC